MNDDLLAALIGLGAAGVWAVGYWMGMRKMMKIVQDKLSEKGIS